LAPRRARTILTADLSSPRMPANILEGFALVLFLASDTNGNGFGYKRIRHMSKYIQIGVTFSYLFALTAF
jgi:hypothetical protein